LLAAVHHSLYWLRVVVWISECTCRLHRLLLFVALYKYAKRAKATAGCDLVHINPSSWDSVTHLSVGLVRCSVPE